MKKTAILLCALALIAGKAQAKEELLPYQDKSLPAETRAADLVSRLTIEEKTSLMMHPSAAVPRLGIKAYNWWSEALHGVARNGSATVFPQPIGMAASFDEDLVLEVFTAVSDEARVKHRMARQQGDVKIYQGLTFWTPNINIFRDPRWGRGMETYGEDPFLTAKLGSAVVHGLQGSDDSPVRKLHACAKHYAVHSGPESIRHSFDAQVSERDLRETYLPAFKELVVKAGVEEVMTAYNRFRGEPCGASPYLIDTILRGEWGYKGIITSDCWAVSDFYVQGRHGFSPDAASAAAAAVHAGVDTECGETYRHIPEAVERGLLDVKDIDRNLIRLIADRYRLGEMDGIDPWENLPENIVEGAEHKALSRKMAEESIVLLQNNGILPLKEGQKVALVGPNADDKNMQWGNYNPIPNSTVTLKDALEARIPGLVYTKGCGLVGAELIPDGNRSVALARPALDVNAVLKQVEGCDIVVFAGGISPRLEGEEMRVNLPGFSGGDRTDIELPAVQKELILALHDNGKKVIFVNFSGSAISMEPFKGACEAILQAWYPGDEGGEAIADILYGKVVPSGKLPLTFYKSIDQLPEFTDYDMAGHTYRYLEQEPEYPFGFGLSYARFKYGRPRMRGGEITVKVKNRSKVDAVETVQLYVNKPDDKNGPVKTLRGFKRVFIPAGKSVKVSIPVTEDTFQWWNEEAGDMTPGKGRFVILTGGSSADKALKGRKVTV